jgi:hypothetical protein
MGNPRTYLIAIPNQLKDTVRLRFYQGELKQSQTLLALLPAIAQGQLTEKFEKQCHRVARERVGRMYSLLKAPPFFTLSLSQDVESAQF